MTKQQRDPITTESGELSSGSEEFNHDHPPGQTPSGLTFRSLLIFADAMQKNRLVGGHIETEEQAEHRKQEQRSMRNFGFVGQEDRPRQRTINKILLFIGDTLQSFPKAVSRFRKAARRCCSSKKRSLKSVESVPNHGGVKSKSKVGHASVGKKALELETRKTMHLLGVCIAVIAVLLYRHFIEEEDA
jgi:hypothetical protein